MAPSTAAINNKKRKATATTRTGTAIRKTAAGSSTRKIKRQKAGASSSSPSRSYFVLPLLNLPPAAIGSVLSCLSPIELLHTSACSTAVQRLCEREELRRFRRVTAQQITAQRNRATRRLLFDLPAAILRHGVASFLMFDECLDMCAVSRAVQPLAEELAVVSLNKRFPEGLQIVARKQAIVAKAKATKAKRRRGKRRSAQPSASNTAPSPSYSVSDARFIKLHIEKVRSDGLPYLSISQAHTRFRVSEDALMQLIDPDSVVDARFGKEYARHYAYMELMDVMAVMLKERGHVSKKMLKELKKQQGEYVATSSEETVRKEEVKAAILAAGLEWEEDTGGGGGTGLPHLFVRRRYIEFGRSYQWYGDGRFNRYNVDFVVQCERALQQHVASCKLRGEKVHFNSWLVRDVFRRAGIFPM